MPEAPSRAGAAAAAATAVAVAVLAGGCGAQGSRARGGSSAPAATATPHAAGTTDAAGSVTSRARVISVAARRRRRHGVTIPAVIQHSGDEVAVYERVTIASHPYLLRLDTGASQTVIYSGVAARLRLRRRGAAQQVQTVGCEITDQPVRLAHWSLRHLRLPPTTAISQDEPGEIADASINGVPIAGLLGSDVLSRLHSVSVDFTGGRLIVGAARHRGGRSVALTVHRAASGATDLTARATVHGISANYLIDTGGPTPLLLPGEATRFGLSITGSERDISGGAGCTDDATPIEVSDWRLGSIDLPAAAGYASAESFVVPEDGSDIAGLIGADTLAAFHEVTFEFGRGRLVLGGSAG